MLTAILRAHGLSVFSNQTGANLPQGIASAILATIPLDGRLTEDVAVLEVDEAYGPQLANELAPHCVLLINVQVDQLNRFYDPARVVGMLEEFARVADRHLVFNGDDHNLVEMALRLSGNGATQSAFVVAPALLNDGPAWLARGDNPALAVSAEQPNAAVVVEALGDRSATLSIDGKLATVALPGRGLHYAADAADCFFADDSAANIKGARAVGITAHQLTSHHGVYDTDALVAAIEAFAVRTRR